MMQVTRILHEEKSDLAIEEYNAYMDPDQDLYREEDILNERDAINSDNINYVDIDVSHLIQIHSGHAPHAPCAKFSSTLLSEYCCYLDLNASWYDPETFLMWGT